MGLRRGQLKMLKCLEEDGIECKLGPTVSVYEDEKGKWVRIDAKKPLVPEPLTEEELQDEEDEDDNDKKEDW